MWGHVNEPRAGKGKTGANGSQAGEANPSGEMASMTRSEIKVAKRGEGASRKAAIVYDGPVP